MQNAAFYKQKDRKISSGLLLYVMTELLSYDLILECTLDILVALDGSLVCSELLSRLYCDILLVYLKTCSYESLSELSCSN